MSAPPGYTENLSSIVWRNPEFLSYFGSLTEANVLDYFSESPFWDRQSTNQALRMQSMYSQGQATLKESEELLRFIGTEFALVFHNAPSTFVINKRYRSSPTDTQAVAAYYTMNANVYQAPDLYAIFSSRLLTSIHAFQSSLDMVRTKAPLFDPRKGYVWNIEKTQQMTAAAAEGSLMTSERQAPSSTAQEYNAQAMLWTAIQTTAKDMA